MCGIAFKFDARVSPQELSALMMHCLQVQRHRGPDDMNHYTENGYSIGHNRLSIIDLSGSIQPMKSSCGRYVIAFNGEIYNFKELRQNLASKWRFMTSGDTEVVLAGVIVEGIQFIEKMEGMWAFVLWDTQLESAIFSRDRFGKKPIFYELNGNTISIASEIRALAALSSNKWCEDETQRNHYFKFGFMEPGKTIYSTVKELLPGEVAEWSPQRGVKKERYFNMNVSRFVGEKRDAKEQLNSRLVAAVNKRLLADVEVGLFLSGGIDSSLIASIASEQGSVSGIKAFSIGFSDRGYDESFYYHRMAKHLKLSLYEKEIEVLDISLLKSLITDHIGQPFHDSSILPSWLVSNLASQHVKVVLTGDGADEIFCGYERYRAEAIFGFYRKAPHGMRSFLRNVIRRFDEPLAHHSRSLLKKLRLFVELDERYESELPYRGSMYFSELQIEEIFGPPKNVDMLEINYNLSYGQAVDGIKQMMLSDIGFYMPQDILVKVDRATMANSLEARAPFLDSKVVELAVSLPVNWLLSFFGNKKFLRQTFYSRLPRELWYRRKQGFAVPLGAWFRGNLRDELAELLQASGIPALTSLVGDLMSEHMSGRRDNGYRLWLIYVYLLWKNNSNLA